MTSSCQRLRAPLVVCASALLASCANMSGLSGSTSYACKAPDGVTCDSVSGTYANAIHNNLPSQRPRTAGRASVEATGSPSMAAPVAAQGSAPGGSRDLNAARSAAPAQLATPLRSSARILRLWFKPWEDADRDLYDQGYVYVQIDAGHWLIEHAQRQIRDAYAPLRPPPRSTAAAGEPRDGNSAPPGLKGAPSPPSADNLFPGLVPPAGRPASTD